MANLKKIIKIKHRHESELLVKKNVAGCSVGLKQANQQYTDTFCIVVYVFPKEDVHQNDHIPNRLDGVLTDVQEMQPFMSGLGAVNLAPFTYNPTDQEEACLEVQKVAALEMRLFNKVDLAISTLVTVEQLFEAARQSGLFRDELESQLTTRQRTEPKLGLSTGRFLTPIESQFSGAASFMRILITIEKSQRKKPKFSDRLKRILHLKRRYEHVPSEISGLGKIRGLGEPELGDTVFKSGRTTGVTDGIVVGTNASLYVDYQIGMALGRNPPNFGEPIFCPSPIDGGRFPADVIGYFSGYVPIRFPMEEKPDLCNNFQPSVKRALFIDQIVTTVSTLPGDSGSPLVNDDLKYLGMSFAGAANLSFFNTYKNLEKSLERDIIKVDP